VYFGLEEGQKSSANDVSMDSAQIPEGNSTRRFFELLRFPRPFPLRLRFLPEFFQCRL
jgi:hypothetical protein